MASALSVGRGAARCGRGEVEVAIHPGGYVRLGDAYALVAVPRAPRGPLTILVSGLERRPLRAGEPARVEDGHLHVGEHTIALDVPPPPAVDWGPVRPGWREALAAALDAAPPPPAELAGGLRALRAGRRAVPPAGTAPPADSGVLSLAVGLLAGRGDGLTPAGDDVLAGFAAWCHAEGRPVALSGLAAAWASPIGLAYLRCAERGELPDLAARVVAAIRAGDREAARRRARALSGWGASSGNAMLWGRGGGGVNEIEPNFIARPYRGVSVQDVPSLEPDALLARLRSRRVYRRTEFIVAVHGERRALVQLEREDGDGILVGVRDARLLATPDELAFVVDASVDTGNASQLARVAPAGARVCVVEGRFQHVNFIFAPKPLRIRVVEVVPPYPPKLLDMAQTVLDYDEDLPPLDLQLAPIDLRELALANPAEHFLFPCRCAGLGLDAEVSFLDAGPPVAADWTLVGCERSRQIHVALYDREPARRVDFCPLVIEGEPDDRLTLLKCCLRERGIERQGRRLTVPWGASLEEVRQALRQLAGMAA